MQRNGALLTNTSIQFLQKSTRHGGSFDRKLQGPMQKEIEFVLTKLNGDFQATKLHSAILILFSIPFAIATVLCMMQQQRGSCLARVPDPPAWNPDDRNHMPYLSLIHI